MTTATKGGKAVQGVLPLPKGGKFKQQPIDGKSTIKETSPETVVKAAEYFFTKKDAFTNCKNAMDKAREKILSEMRILKITQAKVYRTDGTPERVFIKSNDTLKFEKALD